MNQQSSMLSNKMLTEAAEHAKKGNLEQAITTLKELLQEAPKHEIALGMLGGIYAQIGMHDRAIQTFKQVLELNPNNHLARLHLGISQIETQAAAEAIDTLETLLKLPGDFAGHYFSGIANLHLAQPEIAHELFEKALQTMPKDNPHYQDLLAYLENSREAG